MTVAYKILACAVFITLAVFLSPSILVSQSIQNVDWNITDESKIEVTYDIVDALPSDVYDITMEVSLDSGRTFSIIPHAVTGDIGEGVSAGNGKRIMWTVLNDVQELTSDKLVVKIVAIPSTALTSGNIERHGFYIFYCLGIGHGKANEVEDYSLYPYPNNVVSCEGYAGTLSSSYYIPAIGYDFNNSFAIEGRYVNLFGYISREWISDKMEFYLIEAKLTLSRAAWGTYIKIGPGIEKRTQYYIYPSGTNISQVHATALCANAGLEHNIGGRYSAGAELSDIFAPSYHDYFALVNFFLRYHF